MENASKALIIAGAILLAILIIALGVFIFQRAQSATSDLGGIDETKLQSVNQKFENYEGTKSGSDVRALVDLIRTNNNQYSDPSLAREITLYDGSNKVTDLGTFKAGVEPGATYTVTMKKYRDKGATKGYIEEISVKKTATPTP